MVGDGKHNERTAAQHCGRRVYIPHDTVFLITVLYCRVEIVPVILCFFGSVGWLSLEFCTHAEDLGLCAVREYYVRVRGRQVGSTDGGTALHFNQEVIAKLVKGCDNGLMREQPL